MFPVPAELGCVDPLLLKDSIEVGGGLIPVRVGDTVLGSDSTLDHGSVLVCHARHGLGLADRDVVELGNKGLEQGDSDVEFVRPRGLGGADSVMFDAGGDQQRHLWHHKLQERRHLLCHVFCVERGMECSM